MVHRRPSLARASSSYLPLDARTGDGAEDATAHAGASQPAPDDTAAALSRLARASAPAAPVAGHYTSVSWGGQRLWGSGKHGTGAGASTGDGSEAGGTALPAAAGARQASGAAGAGTTATGGAAGADVLSGTRPLQPTGWEAAADAALAEAEAGGNKAEPCQTGPAPALSPDDSAAPSGAAAEAVAGTGHGAAEQVQAGLVFVPREDAREVQRPLQQASLRSTRGGSLPGSLKRGGAPSPLPTVVEHVPLIHQGSGANGSSKGTISDLRGVGSLPANAPWAAGEAAAEVGPLAVGPLSSITDESPGAAAVEDEAEADPGQGLLLAEGEEEPLNGVMVVREASASADGASVGIPSEGDASQPGANRRRHRMVAAGAAALAARAFATAGGVASVLPVTRQAVAARRDRRAATLQDAEYEAEMERMAVAMVEADSPAAPAHDHLALHAGRDSVGNGGLRPEGGQEAEAAGAAGLPMQRLTTEQALALLRHASLARHDEEAAAQAAAEAMSAAVAALTAVGANPSVGGGGGGGGGGGDAGVATASQGQQQAALLTALLGEVQSLRKQVDRLQWQRPST